MPRPPLSPWKKLALWSLPVALALLVAGSFAIRAALQSYLRSERFRAFLAAKAGGTLRGEAEVGPLHFEGASIYADRLAARGSTEARFSTLQLDSLRAELAWRHVLQQAWRIEQLDIQRVRIDLDGPRLPARVAEPKAEQDRAADRQRSRWLPDRVEIGSATIRDTQLTWRDGALRGVALQLTPADAGWNILGTGGSISHGSLPPLQVQRLDLGTRGSELFVRSAEFRQGEGGVVVADGEVRFDERLDLRAQLRNVVLTPWLAGDWRARLHGAASGEVRVSTTLPLSGPPEITGRLTLDHGVLEALPVLNEIATFTRTQQFRRLRLTRASCDFTQRTPRLEVRNLLAESEGLVRIEGAFFIQDGVIDGTFQIGVTPASLQLLPGAQSRVFTEARAGYLWAPLRLAGPVGSPSEDLTPRLVAAAGTEVIEQVSGAVKGGAQQLKEAAKGALDLLLGPTR